MSKLYQILGLFFFSISIAFPGRADLFGFSDETLRPKKPTVVTEAERAEAYEKLERQMPVADGGLNTAVVFSFLPADDYRKSLSRVDFMFPAGPVLLRLVCKTGHPPVAYLHAEEKQQFLHDFQSAFRIWISEKTQAEKLKSFGAVPYQPVDDATLKLNEEASRHFLKLLLGSGSISTDDQFFATLEFRGREIRSYLDLTFSLPSTEVGAFISNYCE
ncbi:hypothetical protein [Thalassococcus lentus]|uniref:Uncharacterized protein n=1 Tax=Thalassococcus lentus TaxID=1210524 RepID=A0ABT4XUK3_9RHOB|nr:hypothetical protein [Thalassococcus lentus]MDA7425577.1 hypothetical protein [Thalassococcus lentus]